MIVLTECDADASAGAQSVLDWLKRDQNLLIASQRGPDGAGELLRGLQSVAHSSQPDSLLRASDSAASADKPDAAAPTLWQKLTRRLS